MFLQTEDEAESPECRGAVRCSQDGPGSVCSKLFPSSLPHGTDTKLALCPWEGLEAVWFLIALLMTFHGK